MRRLLTFSGFALIALALSACSLFTGPTSGDQSSSSASSESSIAEVLPEVTYQGIIESADPQLYSQGTHRLSLGGGEYLLLESDTLDLDTYAGSDVSVTGVVSTTIEGDGKIMRVSRVESILAASSSALSQEESSSSELPPPPVAVSSSSKPVLPPPVKQVSSSSRAAVVPVAASSASVPSPQASTMAKGGTASSVWTQQYCSSHIGFCVPVHKNWWYKSFGATDSALWHVELSSEEIKVLGDGPISINFLSGSLPAGASDSTVVDTGDTVTGYRLWTGKRHFEISAPRSLRSAVEFITTNLSTYEPPSL